MKSISLLLVIGLIATLLQSCKNEDNPTPAPAIDFDIQGEVNLYNEGTTPAAGDGMTVSIEGSDPLINAVTGIDGEFRLEQVPKGNYTLIFEKAGYGTFKMFDVEHAKDENTIITQSPSLGKISTTSIAVLTTEVVGDTVYLNVTLDQDANNSNPRYVRVFFGTNSELSPENYSWYSQVIERKINPFRIAYTRDELTGMGFSPEATVFVNVAGDSYFSNDYEDPDIGRHLFPNLRWVDKTTSFIIPR